MASGPKPDAPRSSDALDIRDEDDVRAALGTTGVPAEAETGAAATHGGFGGDGDRNYGAVSGPGGSEAKPVRMDDPAPSEAGDPEAGTDPDAAADDEA